MEDPILSKFVFTSSNNLSNYYDTSFPKQENKINFSPQETSKAYNQYPIINDSCDIDTNNLNNNYITYSNINNDINKINLDNFIQESNNNYISSENNNNYFSNEINYNTNILENMVINNINNIDNNNFINYKSNNLANIKIFDISSSIDNENNNININDYTKYQTTQISNTLESSAICSEPFQIMPTSKSEYLDYNININSKPDITLEKIKKQYRVETEIVPVKKNEKAFLKKIKNVKNKINIKSAIKSKYNVIKIFSFLDLKTKLHIVNYNKSFQRLFGLNIEHYKKVSEKYKIYGINGFGKEYLKNILFFEGEYLNGKKNGKGKEYDKEKNII